MQIPFALVSTNVTTKIAAFLAKLTQFWYFAMPTALALHFPNKP
jgi:hypothetical protein